MARASSNCSLATSCDTMPLFSLVLPSKLVSSANDGSAEAVGVAARRATGLATGALAKPPNMSSLLAGAAVTVTGVAAANEPNASELAGCAVAAVVVGALSNPPNISSLDGATQPYTHQTMAHALDYIPGDAAAENAEKSSTADVGVVARADNEPNASGLAGSGCN